tara:strand:+ start:1814 stop:3562 length:1749 start_codon:yes stop_codon:yes gene_type:complete
MPLTDVINDRLERSSLASDPKLWKKTTQPSERGKVVALPIRSRRTFNALSDGRYNNYAAISDIVDNSIDSLRKKGNLNTKGFVSVQVLSNFSQRNLSIPDFMRSSSETGEKLKTGIRGFVIADNGVGATEEQLIEAFGLGAETAHSSEDHGLYGFGMKTATCSLAHTQTIYTKSKNGPVLKAVFDTREFVIDGDREDPKLTYETVESQEELDFFYKATSAPPQRSKKRIVSFKTNKEEHSGWVTIIHNIKSGKIKNKNSCNFAQQLRKTLGKTYRIILKNNKKLKIVVTKTEVKPFDALGLDKEDTLQWEEKTVPFDGDPSRSFKIIGTWQPPQTYGSGGSQSRGEDRPAPGINWFMNERLQQTTRPEEVFGKNSEAGGMTSELRGIQFDIFLDYDFKDDVGLSYQKNGVDPSPVLLEQIARETGAWRTEARALYKQHNIDFQEIKEKEITEPTGEALLSTKWNHYIRLSIYQYIKDQFGPFHEWPVGEKIGGAPHKLSKSGKTWQDVLKHLSKTLSNSTDSVYGGKDTKFTSKCIEQQIRFVTQKQKLKKMNPGHQSTAIHNLSVALSAGFINPSHHDEML